MKKFTKEEVLELLNERTSYTLRKAFDIRLPNKSEIWLEQTLKKWKKSGKYKR